jgi:hypothetical protein
MAVSVEELRRQLEQLSTDIGLTNKFVHGTEDETVMLGDPEAGGPQPTPTQTVRGLVESVRVATNAAIGATANEMRQQIREEGGVQINRVREEAAFQIGLAANEADRAVTEADRARAEADRAVDMTGVGAASKTNFGFVRIGDGIDVAPDGTISTQGGRDYVIPATDSSGLIVVRYAALGHPPLTRLVNPIINLLTVTPYYFALVRRSMEGFSIQLYRPGGQPGVNIVQFVACGTFRIGDGTRIGQKRVGADVNVLVTIPV